MTLIRSGSAVQDDGTYTLVVWGSEDGMPDPEPNEIMVSNFAAAEATVLSMGRFPETLCSVYETVRPVGYLFNFMYWLASIRQNDRIFRRYSTEKFNIITLDKPSKEYQGLGLISVYESAIRRGRLSN